jgi:hypothetical protein
MDHVAAVLGVGWRTLDIDDPTVIAAVAQVREHAVAAKEQLSADTEASIPIVLPNIVRDVRITRGEFETAARIPILRTVDLLAQAIEAAGATPSDIRTALLVGGSSRIPLVSRLVSSQLGLDVGIDAHPKVSVCLGAAILAGARLQAGARAGGAGPAPAPESPRAVPEVEPLEERPLEQPADERPPAEWSPAAEAAYAESSAEEPAPPEPVSVEIDLARTGITVAVDRAVATAPAALRWSPVMAVNDEPLSIVHTGDRRRGLRTALLAGLLAVILVAVLLLLNRTQAGG